MILNPCPIPQGGLVPRRNGMLLLGRNHWYPQDIVVVGRNQWRRQEMDGSVLVRINQWRRHEVDGSVLVAGKNHWYPQEVDGIGTNHWHLHEMDIGPPGKNPSPEIHHDATPAVPPRSVRNAAAVNPSPGLHLTFHPHRKRRSREDNVLTVRQRPRMA